MRESKKIAYVSASKTALDAILCNTGKPKIYRVMDKQKILRRLSECNNKKKVSDIIGVCI